ncbi:Larval cuticle protein A3A [Orchesella cincta]|uniref:Larval cuticle protein A3A n=1 Tax=Orchesella cincta TaxID=48709 RepID=A0A1D2NEV0_ORCCI|nr:Larval cuticle protein A3A [Orchesella cincta]
MAVLKLLVSVAVLGTVIHSQDIYTAYSPGQYASAGGTALARGVPRLIPVKSSGQSLGYRAAATGSYPSQASSPGVLKRGRVLSAPSPMPPNKTWIQLQEQVSTIHNPFQQCQTTDLHLLKFKHHQSTMFSLICAAIKAVRRPPTADPVDDEQEEYPSDPNPQYNFSFDIKDDELTNYQNRQEERDGQTIKGSYSVVDPDGYVRTVTYTADPKNGFQAKVTREPTDVKIKFPVPTEAPQQAPEQQLHHKVAGPQARGQSYIPQGQYQHQPQYQSPPQYQQAAYATPQQTYAAHLPTSPEGPAGLLFNAGCHTTQTKISAAAASTVVLIANYLSISSFIVNDISFLFFCNLILYKAPA